MSKNSNLVNEAAYQKTIKRNVGCTVWELLQNYETAKLELAKEEVETPPEFVQLSGCGHIDRRLHQQKLDRYYTKLLLKATQHWASKPKPQLPELPKIEFDKISDGGTVKARLFIDGKFQAVIPLESMGLIQAVYKHIEGK